MTVILATLLGVVLIGIGLWDAFETIVLPRRVSRPLRLARAFYQFTWAPYAAIARRIGTAARREAYLSFYGPLSLVLLVGVWAAVLVLGFGVLHWADGQGDIGTDVYLSGTTFFTLGLGDVVPNSGLARALTVVEAGTGFGFLALVIGYLPIVYQMFARREMNVSLLDHRAGSPPSAVELLRRNVDGGDLSALVQLLRDWEIWLADLLENHLSYPALAYFRSQHENQSWVAVLAVILDVCAFGLACGGTHASRQAGFTFAVARHAAGDLTHVLSLRPEPPPVDRLDPGAAERLWELARACGLATETTDAAVRLTAIRGTYEPYLQALSTRLLMPLPHWIPAPGAKDNWESTAWDFESPVALFGPNSPFSR
ncbi:MAG TPA: potassium channel family protein [Chloroflexota bacterium]|nr:potassium channel family protein [Chloroflexota bacterium]